MIRIPLVLCVLLLTSCNQAPSTNQPSVLPALNGKPSPSLTIPVIPSAPDLKTSSHFLQDFHSGETLASRNPDLRVEPASLTKIMTSYVIFQELKNDNLQLTDLAQVSEKAWKTEGSRMFIEVNTKVSIEKLLHGMIIQSGNDASVTLAEHIAGSEKTFASLMNRYAKQLGMNSSHFMNSTGLPHKDHYTTARDMALLTRSMIKHFPNYYRWHAIKKYTYNKITQYNRNKLLWRDDRVDGVKTGFTKSAGYCLIGSALQDKMRLISVVMGADSSKARVEETRKLINYGFRFFETHKLYDSGQLLSKARIWKGEQKIVSLGTDQAVYVTIPRGQYQNLKPAITIAEPLIAPIQQSSPHGQIQIILGQEVLSKTPLIALQNIAEGSLIDRLTDHIKLLVF
jgi:serine-type D-Ala-D-Ala carboxypeptidase (penicillin-binding protein 5/6)